MFSILGILTSLLNGAITAYNKSKDVTIAGYQAVATIATAQAQSIFAWVGHPFSPPAILAYSVALYYGKAILYDKIVSVWLTGHEGFTSGLSGETANVAMIVVTGMFVNGLATKILK